MQGQQTTNDSGTDLVDLIDPVDIVQVIAEVHQLVPVLLPQKEDQGTSRPIESLSKEFPVIDYYF